MNRAARLHAGRGFAAFGRPAFASELLDAFMREDAGAEHILLFHHGSTDPAIAETLRSAAAARGASFTAVAFERGADPDQVAAMDALPSECLTLVYADLRKMVSDRLDARRSHVRRKKARKKVVVDLLPYEVFPWRVFFPFAAVDKHLLGYAHSYALEQDYDKFLDGLNDQNPCDAELVASKTWTVAFVEAPAFFVARPEVVVIEASKSDHAEYARVRDALFDSEKAITGVKSKLTKWIQKRYPTRTVKTDPKWIYASPDRIVRTDLPFDRWLVDDAFGIMDHTDRLLALYAERQREADA